MKTPGIQPHDRLLVERSLCGDEAAYGSLIERYGSIVRGIALYQGAREDADDVTQEVFLRAWSALSQLERADRFGPWVAQIARNTGHAWRHRRRLRSDAESSAGYRLLPDTPPTPGDLVESRQATRLLSVALDNLPPEYRVLICLHYLEDCSYRQIARCLDMPVTTVRWRVLRGMQRLRTLLPADLRLDPPGRCAHVRLRRAVLAAIATGALPTLATAAPMRPVAAPLLWWSLHRRALVGVGLSALVHLALLDVNFGPQASPMSVTVTGPRGPAIRWTPSTATHTSADDRVLYWPAPPLEELAAPPEPPTVAPLAYDARRLALLDLVPQVRRSRKARTDGEKMLAQLARRSLATPHVPAELELLRLRDLDLSGSRHAVVVIDSADRRNLRGFLHIPGLRGLPGWWTAMRAGRFVSVLRDYLRHHTGLEIRHYEGNEWGHTRSDEWLEYPIMLNAPGFGPFARDDFWSDSRHLGPDLGPKQVDRLSRYLRGGGFMFIEGNPWYLRKMVSNLRTALGGEGRLLRVPLDHPIYHSYYDFPGGFPGERRMRTDLSETSHDPWYYPDLATLYNSPYSGLWGVEWESELVAVFSPQQILGLAPPMINSAKLIGHEDVSREEMNTPWLRAATNIVVYALTRSGSVAEQRTEPWAYASTSSLAQASGLSR